jgi:hypothetical protein
MSASNQVIDLTAPAYEDWENLTPKPTLPFHDQESDWYGLSSCPPPVPVTKLCAFSDPNFAEYGAIKDHKKNQPWPCTLVKGDGYICMRCVMTYWPKKSFRKDNRIRSVKLKTGDAEWEWWFWVYRPYTWMHEVHFHKAMQDSENERV